MRPSILAFLSVLSSAAGDEANNKMAPDGPAPEGSSKNFDGDFEISVVETNGGRRDIGFQKRSACSGEGILVASLKDGTLRDAQGRTGYISSDHQLQFDDPPQINAIYTAGFSACENGLLALGPSTNFYKCRSGSFYNLYDKHSAKQCSRVEIKMMPCGAGGSAENEGGHVVGTESVPATVVVTQDDGQPQVITTDMPIPICQIGDGQIQAHTTPCESIPKGPGPSSPGAPVSESSDGQVQATGTARPPIESEPGPIGSKSTRPTTKPHPTSGVNSTSIRTPTHIPTESAIPTTVPPPASGAGSVEMGSIAAFAVGILGAAWFL